MGFDQYFHDRAGRFSSFYKSEPVSRALGRGALFERIRFATEVAESIGARTVLDVGCGSGPLFAPFVKRGIEVKGIDPAAGMVALARTEAGRLEGKVDVEERGWESLTEEDSADLAVALGVFDYVNDAEALLDRLSVCAPSVVASFPTPSARTALRNLRYGLRGVEVYGYDPPRLVKLGISAGLRIEVLFKLGRAGYAVHYRRAPVADRR